MKINLKNLIFLPLLFLFLPSFNFSLPGIKTFEYYFLSLYIAIITLLVVDFDYTINKILKIIKFTPFKYYVIFWILLFINSLCLSFWGITTILFTLSAILFKLFLGIAPSIIYFICLIKKYLSFAKFIKIFLFLFWLNLVFGFIAYIGRYFDISIINTFFDVFANSRLIGHEFSTFAPNAALYFQFGKRLTALHAEPGFLAEFLFIFLPFVYTFGNTKLKMYKNKIFNFIFKKTLILFTWVNIILTKSPIMLIASLLITIIFYYKSLIKYSVKYFYILVIVFSCLPFLILGINFLDIISIDTIIKDSYIIRVLNVITSLKSYDMFVTIEPSLATRVTSFINEICIFIQYPFTGVGINNIGNYIYNQLLISPVPLTEEIISRNQDAIRLGRTAFCNRGFIYTLLAENGLFLTFLYVFFYIKTFLNLNKIYNKFYYMFNLYELNILKSLLYSLIALFILFIYDLNLTNKYLNLLLSLSFLFIFYMKCKNKYEDCSNENY